MVAANGKLTGREQTDRLDCAQGPVLGLRCGCFGGEVPWCPGWIHHDVSLATGSVLLLRREDARLRES